MTAAAGFLESLPSELRPLARSASRLVRSTVPDADEGIRFGALCWFREGAPFGSIGGNVGMLEAKSGTLRLSFIQGAGLADPGRLLRGSGKAKRFVELTPELLADAKLRGLISASASRRML